MNEPEKPDGYGVSEDFFEELISVITPVEPVAVIQIDSSSLMVTAHGFPGDPETHFVLEVITNPPVVIASNVEDAGAGLNEIVDLEEDLRILPGNNRAVLEPEVVQVTENIYIFRFSPKGPYEAEKPFHPRSLQVRGIESKMGIAEKDYTSPVGLLVVTIG